MSMVKARNIKYSETVLIGKVPYRVLRSSKRGDRQEIVLSGLKGLTTVFFDRDSLVERLGFSEATKVRRGYR